MLWKRQATDRQQIGICVRCVSLGFCGLRRGEHQMANVQVNIERELREKITPGTLIPKPKAKGGFIVKGWGIRRGENALIYLIPNWTEPTKPHQKGITTSEWKQAIERLTSAGDFSHQWFKRDMPACAKEGSCNFTTIGGIFELLGYAYYAPPGVYRKTVG